jgi:hypothetical protein
VDWSRPLPASCLRGLRAPGWVYDDGVICSDAFMPDSRTARGRVDGGIETSINWEDDEDAIAELRKSNAAQHGVARLRCEHIEIVDRSRGLLLAERKDSGDGNPYHGNIVFAGTLAPRRQRELAAALALFAERI